jgi:acetylornithine deacetylase/succinyl-diaminopimelate desuccinylase-like protein
MNQKLLLFLVALHASLWSSAAAPAPSSFQVRGREIFAKIISMPTSVGLHQVPAMAEYLAGEFRSGGFPAEDVRVLPLKLPLEEVASLVVRYRGDGSGGKPILLLAHMDVVTAKREDWQRDPFVLTEEAGFFFGRGTSDDKQGVAALTATFLRLKAEGFVPRRDLIIYFSGDEETMQASTANVARQHRDLIDAEFALNSDAGGGVLDEQTGQPLIYFLQTAEKTYADFELTARNPGGHSSLPRDDNAIYELVDALSRLRAFRFPVMWNETTRAGLAAAGASTAGEIGDAMRRFAANPADSAAITTLSTSPAQAGMIRTTCVATMLAGGHAPNALPQSATANVNCRIFPGVGVDEVRDTLQKISGSQVEVRVVGEPTASDASPLRDDVMAAVTRVVRKRYPGLRVAPQQASGATDGKVFRAIGIPTYGVDGIFMKNSDMFAHGLNERVPVQSFYDSLEFWHALLTVLAGAGNVRQ